MERLINMTTSSQDLDRFQDKEDLLRFYEEKGIDGLELMLVGNPKIPEKIPPGAVKGVHLSFYPCWYDFWNGNLEALNAEFGTPEAWKEVYGGETQDALVKRLKLELDAAQRANVKYVVFHVSECTLGECFTYRFLHTDEEVCTSACELINTLLEGENYSFFFLVENLWWSGFTMTDSRVTEALLNGIQYEKKGIMLDTGHLLHTNRGLRTQEEGIAYIHRILDGNGHLCSYIRGIHLQQSLSGEYVEKAIQTGWNPAASYTERLRQTYSHIFQIDRHNPFTGEGIGDLVQRINPAFLTFELITKNREVHEKRLWQQIEALKGLR